MAFEEIRFEVCNRIALWEREWVDSVRMGKKR